MAVSIYLAGPDVFLANALEVGERKRELCRRFGFEGLFPLDQDESVGADAAKIFQANCALMRRADIGLFNLTPFRGPSADCGTVFELGFALITRREPSDTVKRFATRVLDYAVEIVHYLTYNDESPPFPFSELPSANDDAE